MKVSGFERRVSLDTNGDLAPSAYARRTADDVCTVQVPISSAVGCEISNGLQKKSVCELLCAELWPPAMAVVFQEWVST